MDNHDDFVATPGMNVLFLPGDPSTVKDATDVAVALPELPSTPAMLSASCHSAGLESLLDGYRTLRVVEARNRWTQSRAAESLATTISRACTP